MSKRSAAGQRRRVGRALARVAIYERDIAYLEGAA